MSDYSESGANPLRLLTEVTGMLAPLCLGTHGAHSELLILAMSLSTLHSLPVTDPCFFFAWNEDSVALIGVLQMWLNPSDASF